MRPINLAGYPRGKQESQIIFVSSFARESQADTKAASAGLNYKSVSRFCAKIDNTRSEGNGLKLKLLACKARAKFATPSGRLVCDPLSPPTGFF